eukprot:3942673-Prymnesium_polylepis.1
MVVVAVEQADDDVVATVRTLRTLAATPPLAAALVEEWARQAEGEAPPPQLDAALAILADANRGAAAAGVQEI